MVGLHKHVMNVAVSVDDDLNVDPRFSGQLGYLFRRLTGAESAQDRRYNCFRNDPSVSDFRQKAPLPE